ncbi:hypothetical protein [Singulisphaera sp. PoT]|uniref:hypothetical protein n=1 Tax=Singulisphaera sp. PoT TaxID=3411797 RepID=UPI003BF58C25
MRQPLGLGRTLMIDIRHWVETTAFHEAGHAMAAAHYGIPFSKVWILKRTNFEIRCGEILGQLIRINAIDKPSFFGRVEDAKAEAVLSFCGPLAECRPYPPGCLHPDFGSANLNDWLDARSILRFATTPCSKEGLEPFKEDDLQQTKSLVDELLNECGSEAMRLVSKNLPAIERIARGLLSHWELMPSEVQWLCGLDGSPRCVF